MAEYLESRLVTAIGHFAAVTPAGPLYTHRERLRARVPGKDILAHIVEIIEHQIDVVEESTLDRDIGLVRLVPRNERVRQYILERTSDSGLRTRHAESIRARIVVELPIEDTVGG